MAVTQSPMDPKWLKDELAKPGRSQTGLAKWLGYDHPSIVNRMCSGDRQIKALEADKIREYLTVTERGSPATLTHIAPKPAPTALLTVKGTVEAGSWREVALADLEHDPETLIAPRSVVDSGAFALRVAGPSMDRLYPDGSYVVVQPWHGGHLPYGKRVVVERSRNGLVETTLKELVRNEAGEAELWPRSTHPAHQTPVVYKEGEEGSMVRIIGVVMWSMRPE